MHIFVQFNCQPIRTYIHPLQLLARSFIAIIRTFVPCNSLNRALQSDVRSSIAVVYIGRNRPPLSPVQSYVHSFIAIDRTRQIESYAFIHCNSLPVHAFQSDVHTFVNCIRCPSAHCNRLSISSLQSLVGLSSALVRTYIHSLSVCSLQLPASILIVYPLVHSVLWLARYRVIVASCVVIIIMCRYRYRVWLLSLMRVLWHVEWMIHMNKSITIRF